MTKKEFWVPALFFLILTVIFFHKIFLGLIPLPTDLIVGAYHPWYEHIWGGYVAGVPVQNPKLSDAVSIFYPLKSLAVDYIKNGQLPLWNPYMFGGYPLFASFQLGLFFPTMIFYLLPVSIGWTLQAMSQPFFAALFTYLFLRHLKLTSFASIFGAIAYGFGGSTIMWMEWNTPAATSMMLPLLLLFEDKYLKTKKIKWGIYLSIAFCFQIFSGYVPYIQLTLLFLFLWYLFNAGHLLKDLKLGLFFLLGASLSAIFLFPGVELISNSQRLVETLGSQNPFTEPKSFITLLAPDFFGNDATGNFWGPGDHMDATFYVGLSTIFFLILGVRRFFPKREIKFMLIIILLGILISIENPISQFLYTHGVWGGESITMNRVNFLINFAMATIAAYGFSLIQITSYKIKVTQALWVVAGIAGLVLGTYLSKEFLTGMIPLAQEFNATTISNLSIAFRNLILPGAIGVVLLVTVLIAQRVKKIRYYLGAFLILVLILDLFRFGWKFNAFSPPQFAYPETPLTRYLKQFPEARFAAEKDILPANMWVPYKFSSIMGYDGLYPLRSAKLLAVADSGDIKTSPRSRWGILYQLDSKILDNTGTRFILSVKLEKGSVDPNGQVNYLLRGPNLKEVFADKVTAVLENQNSLPRAYITKEAVKASDEQMLEALISPDYPVRDTSLTDGFELKSSDPEPIQAKAEYREITNSKVQVKTSSNQDGYLVVLDTFYPGWKAYIDGHETPIYRTNYNFRGVKVPSGEHTAEFIYMPQSLIVGAIVSAISLLIVLGGLFGPKKWGCLRTPHFQRNK